MTSLPKSFTHAANIPLSVAFIRGDEYISDVSPLLVLIKTASFQSPST